MFARCGIAAIVARRPFVMKLTGDPAFERLQARGVVAGDIDAFQESRGGAPRPGCSAGSATGSCVAPTMSSRRAATSATSSFRGASLRPASPSCPILPPAARPSAPRAELRERFELVGETLAFAGRLTAQKSLDVMLAAVASRPGLTLLVGETGRSGARSWPGSRGSRLGDRVRLLGPVSRDEVLDVFAAADASILSSSWENFPHSVVESLVVGTPVIATSAGGVAEVVQDGVNGLLVPVGDAAALAAAVDRYFEDGALRKRLRANASESVAGDAPRAASGSGRRRAARAVG